MHFLTEHSVFSVFLDHGAHFGVDFVYNLAIVYKRQNFLKVVVHMMTTDQCNQTRVRRNQGNVLYL